MKKDDIDEGILSYIIDKLTAWSDRKKDLADMDNPFWIYRFNNYFDAIRYVDTLRIKYENTSDVEMKNAVENGYIRAKSYFQYTRD